MNKQLQIELWPECRCIRCKFCNLVLSSELRGDGTHNNPNIVLSPEQKVEYIKRGIDCLKNANWSLYDQLFLRGGEVFNQYPTAIVPYWNEFMCIIAELLKSGILKKLFIITSLKYEYYNSLLELTLHSLEGLGIDITKQVMIGTSWDAKHRFTDTSLKNWHTCMDILKLKGIETHITSILTQSFIDAFNSDSKTVLDMMNDRFDFIPAQGKPELLSLEGFFPRRNSCLAFLLKLKNSQKYNGIFYRMLHQDYRRAESIYFTEDNELQTRDLKDYSTILPGEMEIRLECGHTSEYANYADSDACFLCDLKTISKMV